MKKKILIYISILLIMSVLILIFFSLKNYLEMKRYVQIKEDVSHEAERFLNLSLPSEYNNGREEYLSEEDITSLLARGADKSILLDVNKKTYCKATIHGNCANNKWNVKVYLSCKNYKDKEYDDIRSKVDHYYSKKYHDSFK